MSDELRQSDEVRAEEEEAGTRRAHQSIRSFISLADDFDCVINVIAPSFNDPDEPQRMWRG